MTEHTDPTTETYTSEDLDALVAYYRLMRSSQEGHDRHWAWIAEDRRARQIRSPFLSWSDAQDAAEAALEQRVLDTAARMPGASPEAIAEQVWS